MANGEKRPYPGPPSIKTLRRRIKSICQNYTHPWDILSELIQNSVDAIRRLEDADNKAEDRWGISIIFDYSSRTIVVHDNGSGFPGKKWEELLSPDGTDKGDEDKEVGEKGVGLKFCIFSSGKFTLKSMSSDGAFEVEIENAAEWLDSEEEEYLGVVDNLDETHEDKDKPEGYRTTVIVEDFSGPFHEESKHMDIFSQTPETIRYWIRTYTSIGQVGEYLGVEAQDSDILVKLVFKGDPPEWPEEEEEATEEEPDIGGATEEAATEEEPGSEEKPVDEDGVEGEEE